MLLGLLAAITFPTLRLPGPTDAELVERFRGGHRPAFDEIVRRYRDRVYTLCRRWLDEEEGAEEVTQDVFLALFRSLAGFRGDARLSTWIFKVTLNHCRNRRQYRRRRGYGRHEALGPRVEDDAPEREIEDLSAQTDAGRNTSEATSLVMEALATLEEDHRQILLLRDVEDLSYDEIGEILDLPGGTVRSRIHRARTELAATLSRKIRKEDVL